MLLVALSDYLNSIHYRDSLRPSIYLIIYRIAGFCREDFNVASHGIRNIKIRYIFYLVTFYHKR